MEKREEYSSHLGLELSEEGLTKIQEQGILLNGLNFELAKKLKLPDGDIQQIRNFELTFKNKNKTKIKTLCDWWEKVFSPLSAKNILFSKCTSPRSHIEQYKSDFRDHTNLDMDFIHGLI